MAIAVSRSSFGDNSIEHTRLPPTKAREQLSRVNFGVLVPYKTARAGSGTTAMGIYRIFEKNLTCQDKIVCIALGGSCFRIIPLMKPGVGIIE
jgi:hypothetical protein